MMTRVIDANERLGCLPVFPACEHECVVEFIDLLWSGRRLLEGRCSRMSIDGWRALRSYEVLHGPGHVTTRQVAGGGAGRGCAGRGQVAGGGAGGGCAGLEPVQPGERLVRDAAQFLQRLGETFGGDLLARPERDLDGPRPRWRGVILSQGEGGARRGGRGGPEEGEGAGAGETGAVDGALEAGQQEGAD